MSKEKGFSKIKSGRLKKLFKKDQTAIESEVSAKDEVENKSKPKFSREEIRLRFKKIQAFRHVSTKKNPPNPQIFKLLKKGETKNGKGWMLCEYKGRRFLIEEPSLSWLNAKEVENGFEIDITKSVVVRTNDKGGLKLVPKVPPKLWFGLEEIKKKLAVGVNSDAINEIVAGSNLNLEIVENSRHGKFIAIQPDRVFHFDERHQIHIYPGKSVKEHGFENLSLIDFINKYDERLHFKAFEYDGKTYYRFYLKKIKNSFSEDDKKTIVSQESEKEMLLNALENGPNMNAEMVDAQTSVEGLQVNNLEKGDSSKTSSEEDLELL